MKTIILAAAHSKDTPGKQSPDGTFKEWEWSREVLQIVKIGLRQNGVKTVVIAPESEPSTAWLKKNRVDVANKIDNAFYFSLHVNAAPGQGWQQARGIEIWTSKGQTKSDEYATKIFIALRNEFEKDFSDFKLFWRTDMSDGDIDKEANFTELLSKHPSVLLEFLFMNNKTDLKYLNDITIKTRLANVLIDELTKIAFS
ncbi:N-acetylmuramoyl-L-alanine amidase [Patescibacteria group bacterium]|jgi:N-acetylmuramoyl-L-alanine amidase|nr:N-acetylmuramoyl-L-alanine amidase [Patescibacteria group bacterium]